MSVTKNLQISINARPSSETVEALTVREASQIVIGLNSNATAGSRPYLGGDLPPSPIYEKGDIWPYSQGDDRVIPFTAYPQIPIHIPAPEQPGMPYPGPGQEISLISPVDHTPIDEFGKPYITNIPEDSNSEGNPYDDGGVLFPLNDGGTRVQLYDPGFVMYIDKDGNVVCGYPPGPVGMPAPEQPGMPYPGPDLVPMSQIVPEASESEVSQNTRPTSELSSNSGVRLDWTDIFTISIGEDGTIVCGDVSDPVQNAIDAFVLETETQSAIPQTAAESSLTPAYCGDISGGLELPASSEIL